MNAKQQKIKLKQALVNQGYEVGVIFHLGTCKCYLVAEIYKKNKTFQAISYEGLVEIYSYKTSFELK